MLHHWRKHNVSRGSIHTTVQSFAIHFERCGTWCLCNGFIIDPEFKSYLEEVKLVKPTLLMVNDSISENSAQEYGLFYREDNKWVQIDSFTTSWSDIDSIKNHLELNLRSIQDTGRPISNWPMKRFVHDQVTLNNDHVCMHCR
jgi:hypothetical protein